MELGADAGGSMRVEKKKPVRVMQKGDCDNAPKQLALVLAGHRSCDEPASHGSTAFARTTWQKIGEYMLDETLEFPTGSEVC